MSEHSAVCFEAQRSLGAEDGLTGLWYPDESRCLLHGLSGRFRSASRAQRKIQRVGADPEYYWTFDELAAVRSVRKGIRGKHHCDEEVP